MNLDHHHLSNKGYGTYNLVMRSHAHQSLRILSCAILGSRSIPIWQRSSSPASTTTPFRSRS
jgi:hypothetical protein